jgi:hypothetical protein
VPADSRAGHSAGLGLTRQSARFGSVSASTSIRTAVLHQIEEDPSSGRRGARRLNEVRRGRPGRKDRHGPQRK